MPLLGGRLYEDPVRLGILYISIASLLAMTYPDFGFRTSLNEAEKLGGYSRESIFDGQHLEEVWAIIFSLPPFTPEEERMITQRKTAVAMLVSMMFLSTCYLSSQATSQQPAASAPTQDTTDQDIALLRKDLRSQKKQIVAANLNLTEKEAEQFWPVFEKYTDELMAINNKKYAALKEYAQSYDSLTDQQAEKLTRDALQVDQFVAQLRERYIPIFEKVISPKKTAAFIQIDRRLVLLIDIQLSSSIPLVQQQ